MRFRNLLHWLLTTTTTLTFTSLTTAALPNTTIELDLLFPRADNTYAKTPSGLPILIALHNPTTANHYGWTLRWEVYKQQPQQPQQPGSSAIVDRGLPLNHISAKFGNDTTWPDNPHLIFAEEISTTGPLEAGEYTFAWNFRGGHWCEFRPGHAEFSDELFLTNGSFSFTVVDAEGAGAAAAAVATTPTFTGTCATPLGMVDYVSTTVFRGLPWEEEHGDPATQTLSCGVTAGVTATAEPCLATVDEAQEASISRRMGWGEYAATGAAGESGASGSGGGAGGVRLVLSLVVGMGVMMMSAN